MIITLCEGNIGQDVAPFALPALHHHANGRKSVGDKSEMEPNIGSINHSKISKWLDLCVGLFIYPKESIQKAKMSDSFGAAEPERPQYCAACRYVH